MTFYTHQGKFIVRGGKVMEGPGCCPKKCGDCWFFPWCKATVTWSFSIADSALDLNDSGQHWSEVPSPIPAEFADVASGSVTITPPDTAGIGPGGTTGNTRWSIELTAGDGRTYNVTVVYDCARDGWHFVIAGPGTGMFLAHDLDQSTATHHLGLIAGDCTGGSASDAIFTIGGAAAEFHATGTVVIAITDNGCT